jgi:hypothetical protein
MAWGQPTRLSSGAKLRGSFIDFIFAQFRSLRARIF